MCRAADVHVFDEPDFGAIATAEFQQLDQFIVVDAANDNGVDLETGKERRGGVNALEDVKIANDLAKIGSIERLAGAPIGLEGRISGRVAVSTGRSLCSTRGDGFKTS